MSVTIPNKRLTIILITVLFLLLIPLIAMQFTKEVHWTLFDFVVAGALLTGAGLGFEMVLRNVRRTKYRIIICATILIVLLVIWVELAIGVFGTAFAGN